MSTFSSSLISELITITFAGLSTSGSIAVTGLRVGDVVINGEVNDSPVWASFSAQFEPVISSTGHIKQLGSGDLSSANFKVYLVRSVL